MSSLNPVFTVGDQIAEPLRQHRGMSRRDGATRGGRPARPRRHPVGARAPARLPARALGRHAPAGDDRRRDQLPAEAAPGGRADDRARRDDPGSDPLAARASSRQEQGMAIVLVSHDLGVIAQTCSRVAVMYAGYVVEEADALELFAAPQHPYTAALLEALPELAIQRGDQRLDPDSRPAARPARACPPAARSRRAARTPGRSAARSRWSCVELPRRAPRRRPARSRGIGP